MKQIIAESYSGSYEQPLPIGRKLENDSRTVVFKSLVDYRKIFATQGTWAIVVQRPTESTSYPVTKTWESVEGYACWDVSKADVGIEGFGRVELRFYPVADNVRLFKSKVWVTKTEKSLTNDGPVPEPMEDFVDQVSFWSAAAQSSSESAQKSAEIASEASSTTREYAESAAEQARNASNSASSASSYATAASQSAKEAASSSESAQKSAEIASLVSGGNIYVTDHDDGDKLYHFSIAIRDGCPVGVFTESEET